MNKITRTIVMVVLGVSYTSVLAQDAKQNVHLHTLKWWNNDGTSDDKRKRVYEFDGRIFDLKRFEDFKDTSMRLSASDTLDVQFPDEANINDPHFYVEFDGMPLFSEWVKRGVKIIYHYKRTILSRHLVVCEFPPNCIPVDCAKITLDGSSLGIGIDAFKKLEKMKWKSPTFLTVFYRHKYPDFANAEMGEGIPAYFDPGTVKLSIVQEFKNDPDPWEWALQQH